METIPRVMTDDEVIEAYAAGRSIREIAKECRRGTRTIREILRARGVEPRSADEIARLRWASATEEKRRRWVERATEARRARWTALTPEERDEANRRRAKLTEAQVAELRALAASGRSGRSLARQFGIWPGTVSRLLSAQYRRTVAKEPIVRDVIIERPKTCPQGHEKTRPGKCRECMRNRSRQHYYEHREECRASKRKYYHVHREEIRERARAREHRRDRETQP